MILVMKSELKMLLESQSIRIPCICQTKADRDVFRSENVSYVLNSHQRVQSEERNTNGED